MNAQRLVSQIRLNEWAELVKERIASGQTAKSFCEEHFDRKYNRQCTNAKYTNHCVCPYIEVMMPFRLLKLLGILSIFPNGIV